MNTTSKLRNRKWSLRHALVVSLLALQPAAIDAQEPVRIETSGWYIHKPSKQYKDLPALLPKEQNAFNAGLGQIEFVCLKSNYYLLLVQPSLKLRDAESGTVLVRTENAPGGAPPVALTFRNLYKSKALLSRSMDWDADIHYAEASPALLASIKTASDMELTLAGGSYAVSLSGLASRLATFQRFCEKGVIADPAHFGED
ncbi:MAG: hypothetical protein WAV72_00930 [Bradyrhizobium sp.]